LTEEQLTQRRAQIREEIKALSEEYIQSWDDTSECVVTGCVTLIEYACPDSPDPDTRSGHQIQSDGFSPYAAKGLAAQWLFG
jgi:hypothetical protein